MLDTLQAQVVKGVCNPHSVLLFNALAGEIGGRQSCEWRRSQREREREAAEEVKTIYSSALIFLKAFPDLWSGEASCSCVV